MKIHDFRHFKFGILIALAFILISSSYGCDKTEDTENKAPTCSITSPDNGEKIQQGITVTISVDADDANGNVTEICFYVDGSDIGSSSSFPYNYDWSTSGETTGSHTLKATAKDNSGESTSDEIAVFLTEGDSISETGTVSDYNGNTYNTIKIGNQWLMTENLKATHYANGTKIHLVENTNDWDNLGNNDKAMCYYDNSSTNANDYGALYTWAAAMNGANSSSSTPSNVQGVCPSGWHLPSDEEWKQLEMYLGMSQTDADDTEYRGTNEGSKIAGNSGLWTDGNLENDAAFGTSGFTALPGGNRGGCGKFRHLGKNADFWSATENYAGASFAWGRDLGYDTSKVVRNYVYKPGGLSVRCIKD